MTRFLPELCWFIGAVLVLGTLHAATHPIPLLLKECKSNPKLPTCNPFPNSIDSHQSTWGDSASSYSMATSRSSYSYDSPVSTSSLSSTNLASVASSRTSITSQPYSFTKAPSGALSYSHSLASTSPPSSVRAPSPSIYSQYSVEHHVPPARAPSPSLSIYSAPSVYSQHSVEHHVPPARAPSPSLSMYSAPSVYSQDSVVPTSFTSIGSTAYQASYAEKREQLLAKEERHRQLLATERTHQHKKDEHDKMSKGIFKTPLHVLKSAWHGRKAEQAHKARDKLDDASKREALQGIVDALKQVEQVRRPQPNVLRKKRRPT